MIKLLTSAAAFVAFSCNASAAQLSAPPIVSALPDVASISQANAAGVLQYCVAHHLVSSSATDRILESLTSKHAITASADYSTGRSGRVVAGGKTFSIGHATRHLKSQACDMVFKQAKQFK
jgi:hypothetical protein